jgi:hypothetical protein
MFRNVVMTTLKIEKNFVILERNRDKKRRAVDSYVFSFFNCKFYIPFFTFLGFTSWRATDIRFLDSFRL